MGTGQRFIQIARQAGFRESGATAGALQRVMVGIRCSIRLEVTLSSSSHAYLTRARRGDEMQTMSLVVDGSCVLQGPIYDLLPQCLSGMDSFSGQQRKWPHS